MTALCPHCGYDLAQDQPIERAGLSMAPYGDVRFNGAAIHLTRSESGVLWTILKADGVPVSREVIAERIGYEGDKTNVVNVFLSKIRRKLEPHGEMPFHAVRGVGVAASDKFRAPAHH